MELTRKQQEGLDLAIKRYKSGEKYTVISGYAGSGKTTLVKFLVAALGNCGVNPDKDIKYCAPTGKAAVNLIQHGNKGAVTLHKLLWKWNPLPNGGYIRQENEFKCKIVVCDEVSMVPKSIVEELLRRPVHVIFCGDPGQLPPVNPDDNNHLLDHPHVFLDEIMRQAQESDIVRLSMAIREGKELKASDYTKDAIILPKTQLSTGMLTWADQILCATNNNRLSLNMTMRQLLNRGDQPEEGDKVIILRNYWDMSDNDGNALVNGTVGTLKDIETRKESISEKARTGDIKNFDYLNAHVVTDYGTTFVNLPLDKQMILTGQPTLDYKQNYAIMKHNRSKYCRRQVKSPIEVTYAYAITCHKSQGGQYPRVLVLEENFPFGREEHKQWLYTAVTRASDRIVLVR